MALSRSCHGICSCSAVSKGPSHNTLAVAAHFNTALQCSETGVSPARTGLALARQQQQRLQQQEGPAGSGHDVPEAMLLSATGLGSNQAGLEVSGVGGAARVGAEHAGGWPDHCETKHTCWGLDCVKESVIDLLRELAPDVVGLQTLAGGGLARHGADQL